MKPNGKSKSEMTYLFDTENGIENSAFNWWVENFGLNYVAIDENGDVHTISDMDIPHISELEAEALRVANDATPLTEKDEKFAEDFATACVNQGYDMKEVIANPQPYLLGYINSLERDVRK
jgi:hypothetical protein